MSNSKAIEAAALKGFMDEAQVIMGEDEDVHARFASMPKEDQAKFHQAFSAAIEAAAPIIRAEVEREVVEALREQEAWHEKHDDGLSGFDRIAQGYREAVELIERGDHRKGELLLTEDMELKE